MSPLNRRTFIAHCAALGAAAGLTAGPAPLAAAEPLVKATPNADKLGWRPGFSAYSFRGLTLMETLDKIAAVGARYTELFAWQKFSPRHPTAKPDSSLPAALRSDLKKKASDLGIRMVACYASLNDAEAAKKFFPFAAEMGFEAIVSEPPETLLDTVEKLTEQYNVNLALHNHPKPSHYWDPEVGLKALGARSQRMAFCCDTGHWCRSGLEPVDVLKKFGSRARYFHLKDLDAFGIREAKDVPWGQGKGRIAQILAEVKRQGLKPYFGIEWERTTDSEPSLHAPSIAFLEKTAGELACR